MLTADYDRLDLQAGDRLLDLGCGFGRHAFEALRRGATVVACDMAFPELTQVIGTANAMRDAGEIAPGLSCTSVNGDGTRLPFADASFDRIIASEVMEHVPDDMAALDELTRVLRPGGRFLCLDFSKPMLPLLGPIYDRFSFSVIPWLGERVAGDRASYQYLVESIRRFPDQTRFARMIEDAGLSRVSVRNLAGGIVALHSAWRL